MADFSKTSLSPVIELEKSQSRFLAWIALPVKQFNCHTFPVLAMMILPLRLPKQKCRRLRHLR